MNTLHLSSSKVAIPSRTPSAEPPALILLPLLVVREGVRAKPHGQPPAEGKCRPSDLGAYLGLTCLHSQLGRGAERPGVGHMSDLLTLEITNMSP